MVSGDPRPILPLHRVHGARRLGPAHRSGGGARLHPATAVQHAALAGPSDYQRKPRQSGGDHHHLRLREDPQGVLELERRRRLHRTLSLDQFLGIRSQVLAQASRHEYGDGVWRAPVSAQS